MQAVFLAAQQYLIQKISSLFTSSKAFCRSRYTAAARRLLVREVEMSCKRMLIASRVPDPGLKPVALTFGGVADHLILCNIIFSITFPITESNDIGRYALFFLGMGTIVASFQHVTSLPLCRERVYKTDSCCRKAVGAFLSME